MSCISCKSWIHSVCCMTALLSLLVPPAHPLYDESLPGLTYNHHYALPCVYTVTTSATLIAHLDMVQRLRMLTVHSP